MSILDGNFLRGVIGDYYFRKRNYKQEVCAKPKKPRKQTAASKKSADTFGIASALGGYLRETFRDILNGYRDEEMHNRITNQLNACLIEARDVKTRKFNFEQDSFQYLSNIDFNLNSVLKKSLTILPDVSLVGNRLTVSFPQDGAPAKLKFPKGYANCWVQINVSYFRLKEHRYLQYPARQKLDIKHDQNNLNGQHLDFEVPQGCLCVVSVYLDFYKLMHDYTITINSKNFRPSGIVASVMSSGTFIKDGRYWGEMDGLKFKDNIWSLFR